MLFVENRHFILGADNANEENISTTLMQGDQHNYLSQEAFESETKNITKVLNEELGVSLAQDEKPFKNSSNVCSSVKEFSNGMSKEQLKEIGL